MDILGGDKQVVMLQRSVTRLSIAMGTHYDRVGNTICEVAMEQMLGPCSWHTNV